MSYQEIDRLMVVRSCAECSMRQRLAAEQLGLSPRHLRRLLKRYRDEGASGLTSKHRGRIANNAIDDSVRVQALSLIKCHYHDFAPTLAHEYLTEQHGLSFSVDDCRGFVAGQNQQSTHSSKSPTP